MKQTTSTPRWPAHPPMPPTRRSKAEAPPDPIRLPDPNGTTRPSWRWRSLPKAWPVFAGLAFLAGFAPLRAGAIGVTFTECVDMTLDIGQPLPIVRGFQNDSDSEVTIYVTMVANKFFGGDQRIFKQTLPKHTSITFSEYEGLNTNFETPIGTDHMRFEVTSSNTGDRILQSCEYNLTMVLPAGVRDLIQVPVRWCAIEGSPQAEGHKAGERVPGYQLLYLLRKANDASWVRDAHLIFRPAFADDGIPVIADPSPLKGERGDVDGSAGTLEPKAAASACEEAWQRFYPDQRGLVVVNVRKFVDAGTTKGLTPAPNPALWVKSPAAYSGQRGNDLCGHPRHLNVSDVTPEFCTVVDQFYFNGVTYGGDPHLVLAHELGHALLLGHGNGLDDNHDGQLPPTIGTRRYDEFCDPLWLNTTDYNQPVEDLATPWANCEATGSLMIYTAACSKLQPLQAEAARAAGKLVPGATFGAAAGPAGALVADFPCGAAPCDFPPDVAIIKAEILNTPEKQVTDFVQTLMGPFSTTGDNQYVLFIDTDNNPATGGSPARLGFNTAFQGAELVTRVRLQISSAAEQITPSVWQWMGNAWNQLNDSRIAANAFEQDLNPGPVSGFALVNLQLPDDLVPAFGAKARVQALAQQLGTGGKLHRVPESADGGAQVSLVAPALPACTVTPPGGYPGGSITVSSSGLLPNRAVDVYLGEVLVASGSTDTSGNATLNVVIPSNSALGVRAVHVQVRDTAVTADASVVIAGPALTPATQATLSPAPNGAGWHRADVSVTLTATPIPGGAAVKQITYSASGAQAIPSNVVLGSTATVLIKTEGTTHLDFFATDEAGIVETTEHLTIRLDKTLPSISASRDPAPNAAGWNNTDVTVSFTCSDQVSGVLSCPEPVVVSTEGANQSVTGSTLDFAGHANSVTLSGINIDKTAPVVTCSVATPMLTKPWPSNHELVKVGLQASANDAIVGPVPFTVTVFGNEDDQASTGDGVYSPDAKEIAASTLRLRAERSGSGKGRVYLIVIAAQDLAGNVGVNCCTVVVPRDLTSASIASVQAQAASAVSFCLSHKGAKPPGYFLIGDGPVVGPKQ